MITSPREFNLMVRAAVSERNPNFLAAADQRTIRLQEQAKLVQFGERLAMVDLCVSVGLRDVVLVIDRRADDLARIGDRGAQFHLRQGDARAGLNQLLDLGAHTVEMLDHPVGLRVRPSGLRDSRKRFGDVDDFLLDGDADPVVVK